jgi:uncharacterized protein (DUF1684 family)
MIRFLYFFMTISLFIACNSQSLSKEQQVIYDASKEAQHKLNVQYADKDESPLDSIDFVKFRKLDFFPIDLKYAVKATFSKNEFPVPIEMTTSTDRKPVYQKYGTLSFSIDNEKYELSVFQSLDPRNTEEEKKYLSVPFTDLTSGKETYGGGRYIDLIAPLDTEVLLDFNHAYNPYCAYSHRWSCLVPPKENDLKVAIKAGVKKFH